MWHKWLIRNSNLPSFFHYPAIGVYNAVSGCWEGRLGGSFNIMNRRRLNEMFHYHNCTSSGSLSRF